MKKRQRISLAELRNGLPVLNNGHPAEWLVAAVGQEVADAAVLFEAQTIDFEPEGVRLRLAEDLKALKANISEMRQRLAGVEVAA